MTVLSSVGVVSGEEVEEVLDELFRLVLVDQVTGVNRDELSIRELLDEFGQVLLGHKAACPPPMTRVGAAMRTITSAHEGAGSSISGRTCSTTAQSNARGPSGRSGIAATRGCGTPTSSSTTVRTTSGTAAATLQATRPPSE